MDIHFNGYKIKYAILNGYMRPIRTSQNIRSINIFINLDDLFHTLHRPLVNKEFQVCGNNANKQLVSNVMNLIGHYRNWAMKEGLNPTIYAIYTSAKHRFKNNIYVPDYRRHFFEINAEQSGNFYFINDALRASYPILHVIAKFIPGVYLVDTKYLEPSIIPLYLSKEVHPADWNLLISRDRYDIQYCYADKWSLFVPKGDGTTFLTRENMWQYIASKEGIPLDEIIGHYSPHLYFLSLAIVGDKYRSIPRLKAVGWKTVFKWLRAIHEKPEAGTALQAEINFLGFLVKKKINTDPVNDNLYCIDIQSQIEALLEIDKSTIENQLEDMEDYEALNTLNNDIFREFPINLQMLCMKRASPNWTK